MITTMVTHDLLHFLYSQPLHSHVNAHCLNHCSPVFTSTAGAPSRRRRSYISVRCHCQTIPTQGVTAKYAVQRNTQKRNSFIYINLVRVFILFKKLFLKWYRSNPNVCQEIALLNMHMYINYIYYIHCVIIIIFWGLNKFFFALCKPRLLPIPL